MRLPVHVRKELLAAVRDPVGIVLAFVAPVLIVWVYSLLHVGVLDLPSTFRETSPLALVLCLAVWLSALTMASTALYRERLQGTLERLTVTPFTPGQWIVAKALVLGGLTSVQSVVVWTTARWLLGEELGAARGLGGIWSLALLGWTTVALGLFFSAFLATPAQISNTITFLTLAVIALSGFFKPLGDLGDVGILGRYLPFTLGYAAVQAVVKGAQPEVADLALLAAEGLVFLAWGFVVVRALARPKID